MPEPTKDLLDRLGPEVKPFERFNKNKHQNTPERKPLKGETDSFESHVLDVTKNFNSLNIITTTKKKLNFDTKYLWIIDKNGLYIIPEKTENLRAARQVVCHSNITRGKKALQGGELWFLSKKEIVINYKSGRYGAESEIQEQAVIEYFEWLGFKVDLE